MWGPLLQHFPSLETLGRLIYGDASSIVFNEAGVGRTDVLSSVGTRQGWGSFLYSLTTQPLLQQLADEFPDCKVLAFVDDARILGHHAATTTPPQAALAARAFVRVAASAPLVRDRLTGGAPVLRHAQHALSAIVTEAETQRVVSLIHALDRPSLPRHMEL